MRIQHNIAAMNAYRNYNNNTSALSKNLEKLSSGYKINRAGDDAAGLAISEKMRAQITGLNAAQKNVKDGVSLVKTAEGAMQEIQDMLNRMDYLATQSANGTYDNEVDRANLQKEVNALKTEINRIAESANFNGIKLLDGSMDAKYSKTVDSTAWDSAQIAEAVADNANAVVGDGTIVHNKGVEVGPTSFNVDLNNITAGGTGDLTVKVGDLELTLDKEKDITATGENGVITAEDIAKAVEAKYGAAGANSADVKFNGQAFTVKADGNQLVFTQNKTPATTDEVVDGNMSVTITGLNGKDAALNTGAPTTTVLNTTDVPNQAGVTVGTGFTFANGLTDDQKDSFNAALGENGASIVVTVEDADKSGNTVAAGDTMSIAGIPEGYSISKAVDNNGNEVTITDGKVTFGAESGNLSLSATGLTLTLSDADGKEIGTMALNVTNGNLSANSTDENGNTVFSATTTIEIKPGTVASTGGSYLDATQVKDDAVFGQKATIAGTAGTNVTAGANAAANFSGLNKDAIVDALRAAGVAGTAADKITLSNNSGALELKVGSTLLKSIASTDLPAFSATNGATDELDFGEFGKVTLTNTSGTAFAAGQLTAAVESGLTVGAAAPAGDGGTIDFSGLDTADDGLLQKAMEKAGAASGNLTMNWNKDTSKFELKVGDKLVATSKEMDLATVKALTTTGTDIEFLDTADVTIGKINLKTGAATPFNAATDLAGFTTAMGTDPIDTGISFNSSADGTKAIYEFTVDEATITNAGFGKIDGMDVEFKTDGATTMAEFVEKYNKDDTKEYTAAFDAATNKLTLTAKEAGAKEKPTTTYTTDGTDAKKIGTLNNATGAYEAAQIQAGKDPDPDPNEGGTSTVNKDWNASTEVIKQGAAPSSNRLASTYMEIKDIKDGSVLKVGDKTYTFAVGADSKFADAKDTVVVDMTHMEHDDAGFLDAALKKLTLTAEADGNEMFSIGYQGDGKVTFTEQVGYQAAAGDKAVDLSTRAAIAKQFGYAVDGSQIDTTTGKALTLQIGDTSEKFNQMEVSIGDMHTDAMGTEGGDSIADIDISTQDGASKAVDVIKNAINYVSSVRGDLGAIQNRLEHTQNNLSVMAENIQDAESTIRDTDVAEEMMSYVKNNILVQSAQAMLAQANQLPQGVLQLLG